MSFVRLRWLWISLPLLVTVSAAGLQVARTPASFTASAQILLEARPLTILRDQAGESLAALDTPQIENQIAVVRSRRVLERVVRTLGIAGNAERAPSDTKEVEAGWPWRLFRWSSALPPAVVDRNRQLTEMLQSRLDVRRIAVSHVLEVFYRAPTAAEAARFADAIAEAYVQDQIETRREAAKKGAGWLEERIDELRHQMNAAALAVQEFKARRDYRLAARTDDASTEAGKAQKSDLTPPRREQVSLEELESRSYTYRKMFDSYLQAYAEALQRQSYPVVGARILARAWPPSRRSHPRTLLTLAVAGTLGLMAGLGLAIARHSLDNAVRSARHLRDWLGLPCLVEIPRWSAKAPTEASGQPTWRSLGSKTDANSHEILALLGRLRFTSLPEGIKRNHGEGLGAIRTLGLTSTMRGEGRTAVVTELALRCCEAGIRVLVVDADTHNPQLTRHFGCAGLPGLLDIYRTGTTAADCVIAGGADTPAFLPIGSGALRVTDFAAKPEQITSLLNALAGYFELIIFDLPSFEPYPDGLVLGSHLDATVLVVEWGRAQRQSVESAIQALRGAGVRLVGGILNKAKATSLYPRHAHLSRR